jgi:hypothetical protein
MVFFLGLLRTLTSKGLNWPVMNCRIVSISSGVCGNGKKIGATFLIEFHAQLSIALHAYTTESSVMKGVSIISILASLSDTDPR